MQRICRFEIISVNREKKSLPCPTEWDKNQLLYSENLLPKSNHIDIEERPLILDLKRHLETWKLTQ